MSHFQRLIYIIGRFPVRYLLILSMRDRIQQNSPTFMMIFEMLLLIIIHFLSGKPYATSFHWMFVTILSRGKIVSFFGMRHLMPSLGSSAQKMIFLCSDQT